MIKRVSVFDSPKFDVIEWTMDPPVHDDTLTCIALYLARIRHIKNRRINSGNDVIDARGFAFGTLGLSSTAVGTPI